MTKLFEEWWALYPTVRRQNKKGCLAIWQQKGLEAQGDTLVAHLRRRVQDDVKWADGFVPMPATFLRQERWTDEYQTRSTPTGAARHAGPPPAPAAEPWRQQCAWRAMMNLWLLEIIKKRGGVELENLRKLIAERNRLAEQCAAMWGAALPQQRDAEVLGGMLAHLEKMA